MSEIKLLHLSSQELNRRQRRQLAKLIEEGFAWSPALIITELASEQTQFIVIEKERKMIAYLSYRQIFDQADLIQIYVRPEWRKQGYGQRLIAALQRIDSIQEIYLEVRVSNRSAINLYQQSAFELRGSRLDYYQQPREDAFIMIWERR